MNHLIQMRTEKWSDSRGITRQKPHRINFIANVNDEVGEWLVAMKNEDVNDAVDAIGDIVIFSLTELLKYKQDLSNFDFELSRTEKYNKYVENTKEFFKVLSRNEFNLIIITQLVDFNRTPTQQIAIGHIEQIIRICFKQFTTMGFDPILAMNETLKVVESRTGVWDEEHGKFQKDTSPKAKLGWYKPDYNNARFK